MMTMQRLSALGLVALLTAGCSPPTANVSGKVTLKGQPLKSGSVSIYGPRGEVANALIEDDGTYTVSDAPVGDVRVAVACHPPVPEGLTGGNAPGSRRQTASRYPNVPARYRDPDKSGLHFHFEPGTQVQDLCLQP